MPISNTTMAPKMQGVSQNRGQKDCRRQWNRISAVRLYLLEMSEKRNYYHEVTTIWLSKQHLDRDTANNHVSMQKGKVHGSPTLGQELQVTKEC